MIKIGEGRKVRSHGSMKFDCLARFARERDAKQRGLLRIDASRLRLETFSLTLERSVHIRLQRNLNNNVNEERDIFLKRSREIVERTPRCTVFKVKAFQRAKERERVSERASERENEVDR